MNPGPKPIRELISVPELLAPPLPMFNHDAEPWLRQIILIMSLRLEH